MMRLRFAIVLTAALAGLVALASPAAQARTSTVWFDGAIVNSHVRPSPLWLSADGTLVVLHMRWTSWGGSVAVGSGEASYHGCTPSCGGAPVHTAKVAVRLSKVTMCSGRAYYDTVTLIRPNGSKLDGQYLSKDNWAPCLALS